jgi:hypothetical protein
MQRNTNILIIRQIKSNIMSKDYYHIKANGIRNELKELRKSVDKLTEVLLLRQTSKHENINERSYSHDNDRLQYDERFER